MKNRNTKTQKRLIVILVIVLLISVPLPVFAHSGGTDEDGGHYDSSAGEYHYHHGWPAHQHDGGECPYDFEDNVDRDYGNSNSNQANSSSRSEKNRLTWWQTLLVILINTPWLYAFFSCVILPSIQSGIQKYDKEQILHTIGSVSVLILSSSAVVLFFTLLIVSLDGITANRIITMSVCGGLLVFSAIALLTVNRRR